MCLSNSRAFALLVLALLWVGSPLRSAHAANDFKRYLTAAVRLYESLEYERALKQLERAKRVARGVEEDVSIAIHEGIILAEMGRWQEARDTFKTALLLSPEAKLPLRVSPKVEVEFEKQRERARQELDRMQDADKGGAVATSKPGQKKPASTSGPVVAPSVGPEPTPQVPAPTASTDRPEQKSEPVGALVPSAPPSPALTPTVEARPRRLPVVPLALVGAGAVAGGLGTYFGLSSQGQVEAARTAEFQDDFLSHHQQARSSATAANVLLGTAGLAVAGAVVTWFLMPADAATPSSGETR